MNNTKNKKHIKLIIIALFIMIAAASGLFCLAYASVVNLTDNFAFISNGDYTNADASQKEKALKFVGKKLGIDVSDGDLYYGYDDHGGFHGDGTTYFEILLPEGAEERFKDVSSWQCMPISGDIRTNVCELLLQKPGREDYEDLIPVPENGYWYFKNRSPDQARAWNYMNYTIAAYNSDTRVLFFCIMDF